MILESPAFSHQQPVPQEHTCQGNDVSPALTWAQIPPNTKSLVLIVDDPDAPDPAAPKRTYVHWLLYNIPPSANRLVQGAGNQENLLPQGTLQGLNDWGKTGYGGPCPPVGRHRYFFKLYALDTLLPNLKHPEKKSLEQAMQNHLLGQTELIGTYQKS